MCLYCCSKFQSGIPLLEGDLFIPFITEYRYMNAFEKILIYTRRTDYESNFERHFRKVNHVDQLT
jgi:hypothetical protein